MEQEKKHGLINAICDEDFKEKLRDITQTCADIVGKTIGPYGSNTILQTSDGVIKTKDGWNVLRSLKFNTIIDNSIKGLLEEIASQIVLKVGDGSTTSILAASIMNEFLGDYIDGMKTHIPTKELETVLLSCINMIIDELEAMSTKIDGDNIKECMKKIALVATNWDEPTSDMISDIITETNNPIINVEYSGTDRTEISIVKDSFVINGELVDDLFINNNEDSSCNRTDVKVLVFDHTIKVDYIPVLLQVLTNIMEDSQTIPTLMVVAPSFDESFKVAYHNYLMTSFKKTGAIPGLIPVKYIRATMFDRQCISDFTLMTGGKQVTTSEDLSAILKEYQQNMNNPNEEDTIHVLQNIEDNVMSCMGAVGSIVVNNKIIKISGFDNRDEEEYQRVLSQVSNGLGAKIKESTALSMLTEDVKLRRFRHGKLQCKMGTIKLGGFGQADLKAKKDALDDSIRACESAYYNGYNIGSCMAVPIACSVIEDRDGISQLQFDIIKLIKNTFIDVLCKIISNKRESEFEEVAKLVEECIKLGVGYDLIHERYDLERTIINPTTTDIEVLKGMLNIILLNFTSNQFLFTHFE